MSESSELFGFPEADDPHAQTPPIPKPQAEESEATEAPAVESHPLEADPGETDPLETGTAAAEQAPQASEGRATPEAPAQAAPATNPGASHDDLRGLSWDESLPALQDRHPGTSEGILFCVYKLLQDPEASMRDFRDEAETRGVKLSGRSLHSAKVLLGLAQPAVRRRKAELETEETAVQMPAQTAPAEPRHDPRAAPHPTPAPRPTPASAAKPAPRQPRRRATDARSPVTGLSVEDALRDAVEQIQMSAREEATRLRDAMRQAIEILNDALDQE